MHFVVCINLKLLHVCFKTSTNVSLTRDHATEGSSASTTLAPTSARGTLSTVVEDTTSMKMAHAVSVWLWVLKRQPVEARRVSPADVPSPQISMNAKAPRTCASVTVASTCWALIAVNVRLATSSTASVGHVRVSMVLLHCPKMILLKEHVWVYGTML